MLFTYKIERVSRMMFHVEIKRCVSSTSTEQNTAQKVKKQTKAKQKTHSFPPGCFERKSVTSYMLFSMQTQQSRSALCFAFFRRRETANKRRWIATYQLQ